MSTQTSLRLRPGLTLIVGGAGSGKTALILNLLNELEPGTVSHLYGDLSEIGHRVAMEGRNLPESLIVRADEGSIATLISDAGEGDMFFIDDLSQRLPAPERGSPTWATTRSYVDKLGALATRQRAFVVASIGTRKSIGGGVPVVEASWERRHTVVRLHGGI